MAVRFTSFGSMSMLIERDDGMRILVDPYIRGNELADVDITSLYDVDLIFVSHVAYDHLGDAPEIFSQGRAKIICDKASREKLKDMGLLDKSRYKPTGYGDSKIIDSVAFHTVRAYHNSIYTNENGSFSAPPLGYVLTVEPGVTYYAPGDTCLYGDMRLIRELYAPQLMSVGISSAKPGGNREADTREAAMEVLYAGARFVFPGHYTPGDPALNAFKQALGLLVPDAFIADKLNIPYTYTPASLTY